MSKKKYLKGEKYLRGETSHFRKSFVKKERKKKYGKQVGVKDIDNYVNRIIESVEYTENRREERNKYY